MGGCVRSVKRSPIRPRPCSLVQRHGSAEPITTDGLRSYKAAMNEIGNAEKQEVGRWTQQPYFCLVAAILPMMRLAPSAKPLPYRSV